MVLCNTDSNFLDIVGLLNRENDLVDKTKNSSFLHLNNICKFLEPVSPQRRVSGSFLICRVFVGYL